MVNKRIYIAGPMTGLPYFNYPAFFQAAEKLRAEGWEVMNPAEIGVTRYGIEPEKYPTGDERYAKMSRRECLAYELNWIALQADAIYLLPGWEKSTGASAEKALADALSLEIIKG